MVRMIAQSRRGLSLLCVLVLLFPTGPICAARSTDMVPSRELGDITSWWLHCGEQPAAEDVEAVWSYYRKNHVDAAAGFWAAEAKIAGLGQSEISDELHLQTVAEASRANVSEARMTEAFLELTQRPAQSTGVEARKRLMAAVESGDALAKFYLGTIIARGESDDADHLKLSVRLLEQASNQGVARAYNFLALAHSRLGQNKESLAALEQGCLARDPRAMLVMANWRLTGRNVPKDVTQARKLIEQVAAFRGRGAAAEAKRQLGDFLRNGTCGVEQDERMALEWYARAAKDKNLDARFEVANARLVGRSAEFDPKGAIKELEELATLGQSSALRLLAQLKLEGILVPRDEDAATRLLKEAAAAGDKDAMTRLRWIEFAQEQIRMAD